MKRKHLIIDGYNVIHQWDETAAMMRQNAIDAARDHLLDAARSVYSEEDLQVTVVFDGKGSKIEVIQDEASNHFAWIYSPAGVSADVIIEQLAMDPKKKSEVTVVSQDNLIASSIRASGAFLISPDEFLNWVDRSRGTMNQRLAKENKGKKWGNSDLRDALS